MFHTRILGAALLIFTTGCVTTSRYQSLQDQNARNENALNQETVRLGALVVDHQTTLQELAVLRETRDRLLAESSRSKAAAQDLAQQVVDAQARTTLETSRLVQRSEDLATQVDVLRSKSSDTVKRLKEEGDRIQARSNSEVARLTTDLEQNRQAARVAEAVLKGEVGRLHEQAAQAEDQVARLQEQQDKLESGLRAEIKSGKMTLSRYQNRLVINVDNDILFDSGEDGLKDDVKEPLSRIARIIRDYPDYEIRVEGHTDNVPISTVRFPSNWHLSSSRAVAVLRHLSGATGIPAARLSAVGFGEFQPVAPNDTADNRKRNRRVDIVVAPRPNAVSANSAAR